MTRTGELIAAAQLELGTVHLAYMITREWTAGYQEVSTGGTLEIGRTCWIHRARQIMTSKTFANHTRHDVSRLRDADSERAGLWKCTHIGHTRWACESSTCPTSVGFAPVIAGVTCHVYRITCVARQQGRLGAETYVNRRRSTGLWHTRFWAEDRCGISRSLVTSRTTLTHQRDITRDI
jgi:hypothetical protein